MDKAKLTEAQQRVEIGVKKGEETEIKSQDCTEEKEPELKHNFLFTNFLYFWNIFLNSINLIWMECHWEVIIYTFIRERRNESENNWRWFLSFFLKKNYLWVQT